MKIALIGAGSVIWARRLMMDILSFPELRDATLSLMDIDPVRLETAKKTVERLVEQVEAPARVEASLDRRQAVAGADYVIYAVQVGMHQATLKDFEIPRRYGLRQTIADTLGVGGIFRGLRTIPVLLDLLRDMEEVCPNALLLNYVNPMSMLCLAAERASSIKTVGLCHSVQGTSRQLARYIGVPYEEVGFRVAGINHMAWFLEFTHKRLDAYPQLWEAMQIPEIYAKDKVRFEMMRRLGYFVTESSEHMAEYVPYFIKRDALIREFDIPLDEYVRRSERNLTEFEDTRRQVERGEPIEMKLSHEYAAYIIRAIEANRDWSFNGNVPNSLDRRTPALIPNLPADSIVEVPCLVNGAGVMPCHTGDFPTQLAALNRSHISVHQLAVEAALTGNRDALYQAVMLDPHTASVLSLDEIWAMTDKLIEAHGDALPKLTSRRLAGAPGRPPAPAAPSIRTAETILAEAGIAASS
ncbi:MAG: alpha-glucosidase/alpha-galactosidase [Chloroflexi bacterium]|nr:alpha-glucosidase/alpha-galactosidase [Chloroflexota bacterium]